MKTLDITLSLVTNLIKEQFPQWAHLPIKPVELSGHDNRTFRLGDDMLIRLPSAQCYAAKVHIEQKWLPILAPHFSCAIPQPVALGNPTQEYPWHWSIYRWLDGVSANLISLHDVNFDLLAKDLAQFLHELHKIDITSAPVPGQHNFFRGAHPSVYDAETRVAIKRLRHVINPDAVNAVWQRAIRSKWTYDPVWIHGDFSPGNILIKNNRLAAVIDFGGMAVGDPACDLVIAWTFLTQESRKFFKSYISFDPQTWERARGWALWKALITIAQLNDMNHAEATKNLHIINAILDEDTSENL